MLLYSFLSASSKKCSVKCEFFKRYSCIHRACCKITCPIGTFCCKALVFSYRCDNRVCSMGASNVTTKCVPWRHPTPNTHLSVVWFRSECFPHGWPNNFFLGVRIHAPNHIHCHLGRSNGNICKIISTFTFPLLTRRLDYLLQRRKIHSAAKTATATDLTSAFISHFWVGNWNST